MVCSVGAWGALPPNIYTREVRTLLQTSSILGVYLDHIVPTERGRGAMRLLIAQIAGVVILLVTEDEIC